MKCKLMFIGSVLLKIMLFLCLSEIVGRYNIQLVKLLMEKTISSSCYDAIIIRQQVKIEDKIQGKSEGKTNNQQNDKQNNKNDKQGKKEQSKEDKTRWNYKSSPFQVVFSNALMKQIQRNRSKNVLPYKLSMLVNDKEVTLPMKIDDVGRVVFQKEYLMIRKGSINSDQSDASDDELSQKSSTRDSRFCRPNVSKGEKFQDLKNEQAPKNFWQFAWLFKQKKQGEVTPPSLTSSKKESSDRLDQIKLSKIKEEAYEGEQNSKEPLFHLSLCGNLLKKKENKDEILKTFYENRVEYKDFIKDPPTFLNDSNLVVKFDDSIYTWQLGIAILTCRFAYGKELSKELIEDITKNKFTKSKLFTFFRDPITKLQLKDDENKEEKQKPADLGFKKIERCESSVLKYKRTPDSKIVETMQLKYGKNEAKFILDVGQGVKQEINMKIFLWDCSEKFVISDIDGTITKSDILGQILNRWIHPGVTKLFKEVYKRNYKIIYLTARAIGQYQQTCKFLETVQEDGICLPEGPLLMSPDGYMRSLTRQVIYKTPDYLKTKILASLNQLFPNSKTPIYCGFGNRQTDSAAYLRINIPADKIFQISQKGLLTRQSDKDFTTTYLQILQNINEYFPENFKDLQNDKDYEKRSIVQEFVDDEIGYFEQEEEEFDKKNQNSDYEAVENEIGSYTKTKSVEAYREADLDGFQAEELVKIENLSRSRKSEHEIPQDEIKMIPELKDFKICEVSSSEMIEIKEQKLGPKQEKKENKLDGVELSKSQEFKNSTKQHESVQEQPEQQAKEVQNTCKQTELIKEQQKSLNQNKQQKTTEQSSKNEQIEEHEVTNNGKTE